MSDVIFQPLRFKNLTVKNRIFRSNIAGRFDNDDGSGRKQQRRTRIRNDVTRGQHACVARVHEDAVMKAAIAALGKES